MKKLKGIILGLTLSFSMFLGVMGAPSATVKANTKNEASDIVINTTVSGAIGAKSESWYKFTTSDVDSYYTITGNVQAYQSMQLVVYNAVGQLIDDIYVSDRSAEVKYFTLDPSSVYYVDVVSFNTDANYTFSVISTPDEADTKEIATTIAYDTYVEGQVTRYDEDYYQLATPAYSAYYTFKALTIGDYKADLYVYNKKGKEMFHMTAFNTGNKTKIKLKENSVYTIKVVPTSNTMYDYSLLANYKFSVKCAEEISDTTANAPSIKLDSKVRDSLEDAKDVDIYKIKITDKQKYNVSLKMKGAASDVYLTILNSDGKKVKSFYTGFSKKAKGTVKLKAGTYYVKLNVSKSALTNSERNYSFKITK